MLKEVIMIRLFGFVMGLLTFLALVIGLMSDILTLKDYAEKEEPPETPYEEKSDNHPSPSYSDKKKYPSEPPKLPDVSGTEEFYQHFPEMRGSSESDNAPDKEEKESSNSKAKTGSELFYEHFPDERR
jgi:Na+-transporting methylmalonyl-CoA/oxaloacetate decarboxylase gamma subunit